MTGTSLDLKTRKQQVIHLVQQQRFGEAQAVCAQLCREFGADAESWFLLGAIEGWVGNYEAAETACRRALELAPAHPGLHHNLAVALSHQGRMEDAIACFQQALRLDPAMAAVHLDLANVLLSCGREEDALSHFRHAIRLQPSHAEAHLGLARALRKRAPGEAARQYRSALSLRPDLLEAYNELAAILLNSRQYEPCKQVLEQGCARFPEAADLVYKLGVAYQEQGEAEQAREYYHRAMELAPERHDIQAALAGVLALQGDHAAAQALLLPLVAGGSHDATVAITFGYLASAMGREEEAVAFLESRLNDAEPVDDRVLSKLYFALARLLDRRGQYDRAFACAEKANRLHGAGFDARRFEEWVDSNRRVFSRDLTRRAAECDLPVFIVGMPRSGTSLVEQILASHSMVHGAGELKDIAAIVEELPGRAGRQKAYPECLEGIAPEVLDEAAARYLGHLRSLSGGARRVTDKTPGNFRYLGLLDLLFPGARVIHCVRDPLSTCLSCYFQDFSGAHPYAYDLAVLGRYYRAYEQLMRFWKASLQIPILDVRYEELVGDTEDRVREILDFTGLPWEPGVLDFHRRKRTVATASFDQVRRPIYTRSVARWRNYERHLDALIAALGPERQ